MDRQKLQVPQTARGVSMTSANTFEELARGPMTAPLAETMSDRPAAPHRNLLARPGESTGPSRTETPLPLYQTNPPSLASELPAFKSAYLPPLPPLERLTTEASAKASPRTLAFVEEQRHRLQQAQASRNRTGELPEAPGRNVHFLSSASGQTSVGPGKSAPVQGRDIALKDRQEGHTRQSYHHRHHQQHTRQPRDSFASLDDGLNDRDRRFSHMVEDCFRDSTQYLQVFASRNATRAIAPSGDLRRRQKKRTSLVDSIMGFDEMRPQDLVYGEGSKVDGGFGFALPSRYREGTVLLDSGPSRFSIDSNGNEAESTSYSGYSSSRSSFSLSSLFGSRSKGQQGVHQQRAYQNSDSRVSSFQHRLDRPHSLADRVASANSRPAPLKIGRVSTNKSIPPSKLRHSTLEAEERNWEEVKLDADPAQAAVSSKNDRLAAALGVSTPSRPMYRDDSDSTMVDDSSFTDAKCSSLSDEDDRSSKDRSQYTKKDEQGRRSSMILPGGMSQADIVAICLVQGMVPPGLPPDPTLVSWSSPLSPTNPRNWSPFHKWSACILVSAATLLANAGTNMLAPALGLISETYKEIYTPSIRGMLIGCYVLAFAFAPLLFGPMSEVIGRKPVLLLGITFFFTFTLASGFVTSSYLMMVFRFLTALGASAPMSIGGAVITDIFPPEQRGSAMTVFALAPQLGPVLGPVMGGWVTQEMEKWRWIFYIKAMAVGVCCFPMLFMRESYTPRILAKRAERLRKEAGNAALSTIFERRKETITQIFLRGAIRPLVLFGSEPIIQLICVYVSVIYGIIHLLVATFPAVMGTVYAEYPGWASLHFIGVGVGTITGGIAGGFLTEVHYRRLTKKNSGIARPEFKLASLLYMTWLAPIGLAGYFFITYWGVHWIFADVFIVTFCFGISAAVVSLQSYIVDCYSLLAGSALTSTIVIRSFFGFGATVGAEDLLLHGGLFWSGVALSTLCAVTCVPIVFIVYYKGSELRMKSRYATHKR